MRPATFLASLALAGLLSGAAFAAGTTTATQPATGTTPPATTSAPAATATMKKATKTSAEKTAISKQCSALADAKGLHGKEREKFRSACKKNGGKAPA